MKTLRRLLFEAFWLGGAGVSVWLFPKTTLTIIALGALVTLALRMVERSWT